MTATKTTGCFSRYAVRYQRHDVTCYMNALQMRPVYVHNSLAYRVDRQLKEGMLGNDGHISEELWAALRDAFVVVDDPDLDRRVLSALRESSPAPAPHTVFIILTESCNFDCSYCFINSSISGAKRSHHGNMSVDTARRSVDFFARVVSKNEPDRQGITFAFYGGEPLLNMDALKAALVRIDEHKQSGLLSEDTQTRINTNGSLLTGEVIDLLKSHKVAIGLSMDGGSAEMNACRRLQGGQPAYDAIVGALNRVKAKKVTYGVSVVLSESLLDRGRDLIDSLIRLDVPGLGFNPLVSPDGANVDYGEKVADFMIQAEGRLTSHGIQEERMFQKEKAFANASIMRYDCAAGGGNQMTITPEGKVGICHGLIGTFEDFVTDVCDYEFDPANNEAFNKWRAFSPFFIEACEGCEAMGICGGGCPLRAYYQTGKWGWRDEQYCPFAKKAQEHLVWKLYEKLYRQGIA